MSTAIAIPTPVPPGEYVPTADQRVVMHQVPWAHFEAILALRGDVAGPRMAYLAGQLELMSTAKDHERIAAGIGRLIEAFALERGIELSPYGSWTLRKAPREAGAEPDECYLIGEDQSRDRPDLVIEVVWTSGGIDKLEIYRRLGIGEVWFWQNGALTVYRLRDDAYHPAADSGCLPGLDVPGLCAYLELPTVTKAVRAFVAALRSGQ